MARYFIIALLVVFAICLMQVSAAPQKDDAKEASSGIPDQIKEAGEKFAAAIQDAKPKIEQLLAQGQEFLTGVGKKISEEASKIIPKDNENKS